MLCYDAAAQSAFAASLRDRFPNLLDTRSSQRPGFDPSGDNSTDWAADIAKLFGQVNEGVEKATGGMDLKLLVPLTLLALSVLGLIAGAIRQRRLPLPSWYDFLWFAFNTFVILNVTLSKRKESDPPSPPPAAETDAS